MARRLRQKLIRSYKFEVHTSAFGWDNFASKVRAEKNTNCIANKLSDSTSQINVKTPIPNLTRWTKFVNSEKLAYILEQMYQRIVALPRREKQAIDVSSKGPSLEISTGSSTNRPYRLFVFTQ